MSNDIVVHILDDEESVRKSLAFLISTFGYPVRIHGTAAEFLAGRPYPLGHCLITDLQMPEMDGLQLLQQLRKDQTLLPTIVLTGHGDVSMAVAAMKEGAVDFIEKPFEDTLLKDAIEALTGKSRAAAASDRDHQDVLDRLSSLSPRERQVFEGIVAGKSNKSIAMECELSPRTVEVYRANVMGKMHCRTLPGLVRMAMNAGVEIGDGAASEAH